MAVASRWYNRATLYSLNGTYNAGSPQISLAAQPITVALVTSAYTFDATHVIFSDITNELTTTGGYTAGGYALQSITLAQSTTVSNLDAADPTWTASGGGIAAFRYAIFYINATINSIVKPLLLCVGDSGADVPATVSPNTLTIQLNATGLFQQGYTNA